MLVLSVFMSQTCSLQSADHCLFLKHGSLVWDAALAGLSLGHTGAGDEGRAARRGEILSRLCEAE